MVEESKDRGIMGEACGEEGFGGGAFSVNVFDRSTKLR